MAIRLNEADLTINGKPAKAVRGDDGMWRIVPAINAVSAKNEFRHLRDLRAAVRKANRSN